VVEVVLESGGQDYAVRRRLKSGQTTAEVSSGENTLVTGSKEVGQWVEEHLLGMDRTAFEATFFARQKELEFFANDDGINRVRRISRMLGIDRVEAAQKLLREDRNAKSAEAKAIVNRLSATDPEELKEELEEARAAYGRLEGDLGEAQKRQEAVKKELSERREKRRELEKLYEKHNELSNSLQRARAEEQRAKDRAGGARRGLEEVSEAEAELARIEPELGRMAGLERELEGLDERRQKVEERERLENEQLECRRRLATVEQDLLQKLEGTYGESGEPLAGWSALFRLEGEQLLDRACSVLEGAEEELRRAEAYVEELGELAQRYAELRRAQEELEEGQRRHKEARKEVESLREEMQALSGGEDLEKLEAELRAEKERLEREASQKSGSAESTDREAANVEAAAQAIADGEDEECPTCHRPFESGEQGEVLDTLGRQAQDLRQRAEQAREESRELSGSAEEAGERLKEALQRLRQQRDLSSRLTSVREREGERREKLEQLQEVRDGLSCGLEGSREPSQEELSRAEERRGLLQSLRDTLPVVRGYSREHGERGRRIAEISSALEGLAAVSYDPQEHAQKKQEHDRLQQLQGRAGELKRSARRRPELEHELQEAEGQQEESSQEAARLERELSELGFDRGEYERAGELVTESEERLKETGGERERLDGELREASYRVKNASEKLEGYEEERRRADEAEAAAKRMGEMDGLFTEFFRSLTSRVRPMLGKEASGLVRELTDGHYERMEFDEDYGVKLVDRFEDAYPLERFSGGESDVASLSARVALSRIVSQKSDETLGFLILDEVFGSLDTGRRNNVLYALERLKRSFAQVFIISHVGEIQESALVDEIWAVEEDGDGRSSVHCLRPDDPARILPG
jgi:exonuclease SbcC